MILHACRGGAKFGVLGTALTVIVAAAGLHPVAPFAPLTFIALTVAVPAALPRTLAEVRSAETVMLTGLVEDHSAVWPEVAKPVPERVISLPTLTEALDGLIDTEHGGGGAAFTVKFVNPVLSAPLYVPVKVSGKSVLVSAVEVVLNVNVTRSGAPPGTASPLSGTNDQPLGKLPGSIRRSGGLTVTLIDESAETVGGTRFNLMVIIELPPCVIGFVLADTFRAKSLTVIVGVFTLHAAPPPVGVPLA